MSLGGKILGRRHVAPSVTSTLKDLQVEGTFRTGTHLVSIDRPIATEEGDLELAMYGSCIAAPRQESFAKLDDSNYNRDKMPGAIICADLPEITLRAGRPRRRLKVTNRGDRPVQVGDAATLLANACLPIFPGRLTLPFHRNQSVARI